MANMPNTTIFQLKNQLILTTKMKLKHHLKTKKMMKVIMKILMMTPMRTEPDVGVVAVAEAGDRLVDEVYQGEGGDADAQLDEEAQDHHTSDAVDVVRCTEEQGTNRDHFRQVRPLMSNEQVTIAHSPQSQLHMIDTVHHRVLVAIYVAVVVLQEGRRNEKRIQGAVSLMSRSHSMTMKMNQVHTNPSLGVDLADDVVLRDVDVIRLRPGMMIS